MSGKQFATRASGPRRPGAALCASELADAARAAALRQGLLESRQQVIQPLLHGFSAACRPWTFSRAKAATDQDAAGPGQVEGMDSAVLEELPCVCTENIINKRHEVAPPTAHR